MSIISAIVFALQVLLGGSTDSKTITSKAEKIYLSGSYKVDASGVVVIADDESGN